MQQTNFAPVSIECTKDGIKFACSGDIGSGSVILKTSSNVEKPEENVSVEMNEPVSLTFSLKYLINFCKASGLSNSVKLCLSSEVPLLVEYPFESSYLRFYLAPKVCIYPIGHQHIANMNRLVTRTKRIMISFTHERHVPRIDVGDLRRNSFDMHRASVSSWFWRATLAKTRCRVVCSAP